MSVPSVIDFKFAEDAEGTELPDSNIDLEELIEEDILEKKEPELIKFEEKAAIVHDEIFDVKKKRKKISCLKRK